MQFTASDIRHSAYLAHDARQKGARRPDERTDNRQQRLIEDETLSAQRPARVGVEQRDDDLRKEKEMEAKGGEKERKDRGRV